MRYQCDIHFLSPFSAGGIQTIQVLNILEAYDIKGSGFGTTETLHLVLEALKIAAADRRAALMKRKPFVDPDQCFGGPARP